MWSRSDSNRRLPACKVRPGPAWARLERLRLGHGTDFTLRRLPTFHIVLRGPADYSRTVGPEESRGRGWAPARPGHVPSSGVQEIFRVIPNFLPYTAWL